MQYNRYSNGWSYNQNNNVNFIKVTNNEGKDMILTSVIVYCGAGVGTISSPYPGSDAVSSSTRSFTMSLVSGSITSSTQTINTVCNVVTSSSGYQEYSTSAPIQYTFSFGDGIPMSANSSITFTYNKSGGVLVCPKETKRSVTGTAKDAYSAPGYSYNSVSPVYGALDKTTFTSDYSITGGTNGIHWTNVRIYNSDGTYKNSIDLSNTSKGNIKSTFKLSSDNYSDGTEYKTAIRFSDYKWEHETGTKNIYTFRTPKVQSIGVSPTSFSGIGNTTLSWSCNGRRWALSNEANFKTYYQFENKSWLETGSDDPNTGDTNNSLESKSINLSENAITNSFTADERSQENITTKINVKRKNETSQVEAIAGSGNITIQFWPKYEVNTVKYKNISTGVVIEAGTDQYTDTAQKIEVSWKYSSEADRGMISGYIVRVYRNNKITKVGDDHIISTTALSGSVELDIKDDLYRGELNYIKIIPYYTLPNNGSKKEGPSTLYTFITPLGRIHKPIISFPIHNSNWHNKQFRILLQAPQDDDMDVLGLTNAQYEYNNIELIISGKDINNKAYTLEYTLNNNNSIFSNQIIHHKYNIVINPSIVSDFPELLYYDIKIRFQKKYYKNIWSEYSNSIHLGISKIKELDLQKEQTINISHYSTIRRYSVQLWEVYFNKAIESINNDNIERKQYDIIYAKDYQGIYNTILNIQSRVNNYTNFDSNRDNIKFNQNITSLSGNNKTKQELITVSKISNDPIGRNYKNILVECMNKLY